MNTAQMKKQFEKDVKEICRELNNQPIQSFVFAFDHLGIFKRYEELWGDGRADLAQKILQHLKDDRKKKARRFILNIRGLWQGVARRIWVIASSAQTSDIRRFQDEQLSRMKEQADLFDQWQEEVEQRTGIEQTRWGPRISEMMQEMRRSIGLNGQNPSGELPPAPIT